jgi:hypothetical protein
VVLRFVAWRTETVTGHSGLPLLRNVGPDVVETVESVLDAGIGGELSCINVENPSVLRANVLQNKLIVNRLLIN